MTFLRSCRHTSWQLPGDWNWKGPWFSNDGPGVAKHPMSMMELAGRVTVGVVMGFLMTAVAVMVASAAAAMASSEAATKAEAKRRKTMLEAVTVVRARNGARDKCRGAVEGGGGGCDGDQLWTRPAMPSTGGCETARWATGDKGPWARGRRVSPLSPGTAELVKSRRGGRTRADQERGTKQKKTKNECESRQGQTWVGRRSRTRGSRLGRGSGALAGGMKSGGRPDRQ